MAMLLLAGGYLLAHALAIALLPAHAIAASYAFLAAAPLLAMAAALRRGRSGGLEPAGGWSLAALGMALWALGMLSSLRQDLFMRNDNIAPTDTMLFYTLYGVPLTYAIAAALGDPATFAQRVVDAVLAITLGLAYFGLMVALTTVEGRPDDGSLRLVVDLLDVENVYLALTSLVRLRAADRVGERDFFGVLCAYAWAYAAVAFYYNHYVALGASLDIGSSYDLVVDLPFLLFAGLSMRPARMALGRRPPVALVRFVRSGSPQLLGLSVLVVSIFLMRTRFAWGAAGVAIALLGSGLRSVLAQVRHVETEDRLRRDRERLSELAWRDGLTGVPNRRAFDEAFGREWSVALRKRQQMALLVVDVDLFKSFNDCYGHPAGDACLRAVASALQRALRRPQDLLARYGGEEFVLVLPDTSLDGAVKVAQRLGEAVRRLAIVHQDSPHGYVTVSIGAACASVVADGAGQALVDAADRALYAAKHNGRNRVESSA